MANSANSLDLYAKVEDLLGVKEASPALYAHYLLFLNSIDFDTLLDVGCGSGDFLKQMRTALEIDCVKGIDLSPSMVAQTLAQGYDASCIDVCDVVGRYDVITAVFDMVNYLNKADLARFLSCVTAHLKEGGFFLFDINTLYGFENVAVGSYIVDDDERFVTVDSEFEEGEYLSEFTLFEKEGACFQKSQETIRQYYHTVEEMVTLSGLELIVHDEVNLYALEDTDKYFIVLKKKSL